MKNLVTFVLSGSLSVTLAQIPPAPPAPLDPTLSVVTPAAIHILYEEARTNQPALRSAGARIDAARHSTRAIRSWEDPMFKFGGAVASGRGPMLDQEGDLVYEIEQKLPVFGMPRYERAMAAAEESGALLQFEARSQTLRRDLARQLYQTARIDRQIQLAAEDVAWAQAMAADANERFRNGMGSATDALRLQNEIERLNVQLHALRNGRAAAHARLDRLMNRPQHAVWPALSLPPLMGSVPFSDKLVTMALGSEPNLKVMRQEVKVAEAAARLAYRKRLPEVVASIEGRQFSGDGGFREGMFTVGLTLPWFNQGKYREERKREEARKSALASEAADFELEIRNEILRLTASIDTARREALLYRDSLLPRARLILESQRNAWLAGRGMLTEVLEARRELVEMEVMFTRAVAEQYDQLTELVLCCGLGDLDALQRLGVVPEASEPATR
jgi:outer membrane protein TolC